MCNKPISNSLTRHEEAVELLNTQKEQVELELLFVSPAGDEIGQSTPKMNGHYQEPEEEEEEVVETATTECQTDKVEKHVTFEDAIRCDLISKKVHLVFFHLIFVNLVFQKYQIDQKYQVENTKWNYTAHMYGKYLKKCLICESFKFIRFKSGSAARRSS